MIKITQVFLQVMETYIVAHQIFASRLLVWLHNILESAQTFRLIFSDIINKVWKQIHYGIDFYCDLNEQ